ncbi:MAG: AMP-binding protein [Deltaproteobacteria bacterium]|nr:AMP-binding protein [Deltaproteobacteria bacterium]
MSLYDFTFYQVINRNASCFKKKEAWLECKDNRRLSFTKYKENVDCLAKGLQKYGVKKGDRIAILGKNSLESFLIYGAAAALGAIVLPVNWRLSPEEVHFVINDCNPKVLFVDEDYQELINGLRGKLDAVEKYFCLGARGDGFQDFISLLDNEGNWEAQEVSTEDGFVIIHTAAVKGRPKGALLSHGNVLCANMHLGYLLGLSASHVNLNILPLFHAGGLFAVTSSFHFGAMNVNMSKFDSYKAVKLIQDKKISVMFELAPILSSILDQSEKTGLDIRSLKAIVGIDTPDTIEKYQRVTGGHFYTLYGQTELSGYATFGSYNDNLGSAGKTAPLCEMKIVDDYDNEVLAGRVGEIIARGPLVFKGYWNRPEENAYTFRNGWHHTGDLGRLDEDGFLWYEGCKAEKELIKPGGENVYPAEVEEVIKKHPAVEKTVVFGVPDPKWKEGIKAVCKLRVEQKLTPQQLIDFVGQHIASYKKPSYVQFVTYFPLLEDGSPDRIKIKEKYGNTK